MEKLLIFIKHNFRFLWRIIEWGNGLVFSALYARRLNKLLPEVFKEYTIPLYSFRVLTKTDTEALYELINSQDDSDLTYFNPHGFDLVSIRKQFSNPAFLIMGAFDREELVGYFFLRFFANRKCFVGRLIDQNYRGKGIGLVMNQIMYETSWRMNFRCLSTISKNNKAVMKAHARNQTMKVIKELKDDYLLVEFTRPNSHSAS